MTATLSTEDALQAALDADPANHLLRYALADCLEESAGAVACGRCDGLGLYARQRGLLNFDPMECPNCSGTGRVSDGRREMAEGYRVLAQLGWVPRYMADFRDWTWWKYAPVGAGSLPSEWFHRLTKPGPSWKVYPTRREAEDAAALAWPTLPAAVRAAILGAGA